ncbi:zonular occludens toxin family protein [Kingella oralis]|jgi:hypothetical protein|uniref:Zonula occludens toxin (Zot) n=1 Tax=Kingella oralis ATCC 51147 TaxID=629741 RepID=C4GK38_9NEIS|nr:zonular occludens toxin domain-containing protein [Kingella oralis]EEP68160.1 zonula occludens toxin (Zot) [Kingella oralis ATCC 51147]QMT43111.1 hypothetical protein H3L93_01785 [Kingella oralis]DAS22941.1 MAG TPA: zonular occludens toxin [Inoviridae sp.]
MIILQTGVPGSGKTASIVNILMTDETYTHFTDKDGVKKKRPLFVNGINELQIEHQELTDEQIKDQPFQDFLPYGSLVIIDEAQRLMGNRPAASKVPAFIQALATHRHHGLDIVLITQHPSFLDPFVRKLVQRHMHISIKPIGRKLYEWNECVDQPENQINIARAIERQFTLPKKVFGTYKSAEIHTKVNRRIPRIMIFMLLFVPFMLWFGYHVWGRMKERYISPNQEQQISQSASEAATSNNGNYPTNAIEPNQTTSMNPSLNAQMYVPTLPEKPESKPLYDNVRQVKQYERIAACIKGGKTGCTCYSDQATKLKEVPKELCLKYVEDGLPFDPFREPNDNRQTEHYNRAARNVESQQHAQLGSE